jgi:hypothetical protein
VGALKGFVGRYELEHEIQTPTFEYLTTLKKKLEKAKKKRKKRAQ